MQISQSIFTIYWSKHHITLSNYAMLYAMLITMKWICTTLMEPSRHRWLKLCRFYIDLPNPLLNFHKFIHLCVICSINHQNIYIQWYRYIMLLYIFAYILLTLLPTGANEPITIYMLFAIENKMLQNLKLCCSMAMDMITIYQ